MSRQSWLVGLIVAGAMVGMTPSAQAWSGSPNGFLKPQCTWYVDGRCYEAGWKLRFSESYGRDARRWYDLVTSGACGVGPKAGSIMVIDGWSSNPAGHVAFIESVQSNGRWTVTHANWSGGTTVRTIDGVPIRQIQFEFVPGTTNKVRVVGGSTAYPLRGFIAR